MTNDSATVFATKKDYELRYGEVLNQEQLETILEDATDMMLTVYEGYYGEPYQEGNHPSFDRSSCAVCCAVAHRALSVPEGFEGATQFSQTAGSYNASISFSNPTGDLFLTKTDLKRLGLTEQRIGYMLPLIEKGCHV